MFDDYDDYDMEYEIFREETGHITNYDAKQEPLYLQAIEEYKKVDSSADMHTGEGYKWAGLRGFYVHHYESDGQGLGPFWRIFDRIRDAQK